MSDSTIQLTKYIMHDVAQYGLLSSEYSLLYLGDTYCLSNDEKRNIKSCEKEIKSTLDNFKNDITKEAAEATKRVEERLSNLSKDYERANKRHEERAKELYKLRGVNDSLKIENDALAEENNTLLVNYKKLVAFTDKLINGLKDKEVREKAADELNSILMPF